jgi:PAS domain S-box-containing protein
MTEVNGRMAEASGRTGRSRQGWVSRRLQAAMPAGQLSRIRWLFLIYALISIAVVAFQVAFVPLQGRSGPAGLSLRATAIAGLIWLAFYWTRGYRKEHFSVVVDLGAALVLFVTTAVFGNPTRVFTLLYASVFLRSLYGRPRRGATWTALAFAAMAAGVALVQRQRISPDWDMVALVAIQLPTLAFVTGLVQLIARIVNQSERGVQRERVLSRAAASLFQASGRELLHETSLDAVMNLLGTTPKVQAAIWEGSNEDMTAVAAKGHRAEETTGRTVRVRTMPEPLRSALRDGIPVSAEGADAARWARALGATRPAGAVTTQPLVRRSDLRSVLVVSSAEPIPDDLRDALEALSTQIALVGELRQSERRFRSVVQNSSDVVTVVGPDATIRYVSPSVERVFGYKPAELRGVWLDDLAHPDDRAALLGYLYTAARQPTADDAVQWRWRDPDGVYRDVETVGTNLVHMPDVAGVVLNTRDVSERKALERDRAQLLDKTVGAAEDERTRLAAELHDGPIQRLTTMGYDLMRAHRWLEKGELRKAATILESGQQQLSTEINTLRGLMARLRPPVLDEVGLEAAIGEHMKWWEARHGVKTKFDSVLDRRLEAELETVLYRVTQEALNNVAKHARAQNLWVILRTDNGDTHLEIRDDGVGFSIADIPRLTREGHFGLAGMRQRVEMAGGEWEVTSAPGEGVTVIARFAAGERIPTG